jgi:hypothetical protein
MKTILNLTVENQNLQVLITYLGEDSKNIQAEYFINGIEIITFDNLKPLYKDLFRLMVKNYCSANKLVPFIH